MSRSGRCNRRWDGAMSPNLWLYDGYANRLLIVARGIARSGRPFRAAFCWRQTTVQVLPDSCLPYLLSTFLYSDSPTVVPSVLRIGDLKSFAATYRWNLLLVRSYQRYLREWTSRILCRRASVRKPTLPV